MPNFFSAVEHLGRQSITQPFKSVGEALHGHPGKGFQDLFHSASKAGSDVAHSVGIRGWVGDHPMQSVAALVATIFGGWALWGAAGTGAAGGATAGAAGSAGGTAAAAGGTAGGSGIAAGTVIGQTVPAIPSAASMMSGTGAAVTATPSYSIVAGTSGAGTSLSSGGYMATHLGDEAEISNTGLTSGGSSWMDWAKKANQTNNMLNNNPDNNQKDQQQPDQPKLRHDLLNSFMQEGAKSDFGSSKQTEQPQTTTQLLGNTAIGGNSFSNNFGSFR